MGVHIILVPYEVGMESSHFTFEETEAESTWSKVTEDSGELGLSLKACYL